jgi:aminopeptidase N
MAPYNHTAGTETDLPFMTLSTQESGTAYFLNSYPKPAMGYLYVKDMLGDELFTKALHQYIEQWHGKHPMPYDFFFSMNEGAGQNLNWFWKRWFYESGYPDLAIEKAGKKGDKYRIVVKSEGSKPVPVHLIVTYKDGSVQKLHRDVSVWKDSDRVTVTFKPRGEVTKVTLGNTYDADIDHSDNTFISK